jgi:hypothetical protein
LSEPSAPPQTPLTYPLADYYKVLDGFDIHKSGKMWEAVVVVEDQQGRRHMRLYKWIMRGDKWKVDLARFSVEYWDLDSLTQKMRELKTKYQVRSSHD